MAKSNRVVQVIKRAGAAAARAMFPVIDLAYPKDPNLVVFCESSFSDNSRSLYEYLSRYPTPLKAVWLTASAAQQREIEQVVPTGYAIRARSLKAFKFALRAKSLVYSRHPIHFWPFTKNPRHRNIILLWHAISYKQSKLLHTRASGQETYERKVAKLEKYAPSYSMMIASSGLDQVAKAACHGVDGRKVMVTGLPRTDKLINPPPEPADLPVEVSTALGGKTILYAPTWREGGAVTEFFPFADFNAEDLNAFLISVDAYLLLRPHKLDRVNRSRAEEWTKIGLDRLTLATSDIVPDVADILSRIDVLVTDYSSIYLDLLVVNKPMIFIPYDLAAYTAQRGLLYDYDAVTPGPKVLTQAEFITAVRSAVAGAPDYASHRAVLKGLFHAFDDGQSTRRVAEALTQLLGARHPR